MIAKNSKIFQLLAFLSVLFAFRCPRSEAGRGVAFLILARAERRRWLVLREFAKYAFFGLTRKNPVFERSVLKYVSIKNRILTPSGQKRRVCVNALDRLTHPAPKPSQPFLSPRRSAAKPTRQKRPTLACWPLSAGLPEEGIGGRERGCVCVWKISA